jgi:catechol 2,3-dioxygenase-like lactoylglutathione lyase family enzyme
MTQRPDDAMSQVVDRPRLRAVQPRLEVAGLATSYQFYREVLGFESAHRAPSDSDGFVIVQRDGFGIQLVMARPHQAAARTTVWIHVADAAQEHERVKAHAAIEWGPEVYWYGSREFAVLDPDGHRIIFSSPTNDPPTCVDDEA